MKKTYLYIATGAALLTGAASCSEDFLKVDHYDIVQPEVLLTSQAYVEQGLNGVYDLFYGQWNSNDSPTDIQKNWNLKPHMAFANYSTLDIQPNGWDAEFTKQEWRPDKDMFIDSWRRAYNVIDRANRFLDNLQNANPSIFDNGEATQKIIEAEARAIRAYFYTFLVQNYGGVPILHTGETYQTTPDKPRDTAKKTWDMVIEDLEYARDILDWNAWQGQTGRITKGMVKAYLAQAYMYNKRFADAKKELKDIIDSGTYSLNPCFGQIHLGIEQGGKPWQPESIWEVSYPLHDDMSSSTDSKTDAIWWVSQLIASPEWGGWGPHFTSFEFCWSFEPGDKRLQYEVVRYGETHPYTQEKIGSSGESWQHPFVGGEHNPNNYNIKLWKEHPGAKRFSAIPSIHMRLATVMLNYAECCFETEGENSAEGWKYIRLIRDRAWGASEPQAASPANFPFTLNTDPSVKAPDAQTYYSSYKRTPGKVGGKAQSFANGVYTEKYFESAYSYTPYTAPVWKVALTMERRHEFFAEYSLWYDLCRTDMVEQYLNAEYPKNNLPFDDDNVHTQRTFDYSANRMLYPIPSEEILKNDALSEKDQNPGY
ncbi:SusD family protein [Bacteroidales bacterium Barb6XT]|nr:SusD family protein [Bacteroidales bacterium Barb6XT]